MTNFDSIKNVYNLIAEHFSQTRSWVADDLRVLGTYVHPGDSVLDLACGNARLYQLFVEESRADTITYVGVDISQKQLEMARKRFPGINVKLGEMTQIPCPNANFDVVYCLAAFHHLATDEERLQTLREIFRVLKPDGTLVMTNWNLYSEWAKEKLKNENWKFGDDKKEIVIPWKGANGNVIAERLYYAYTPAEITGWCTEAGLGVEKQYESSKKGSGDFRGKEEGMNIVTIAKKPAY
ncbi:MAG: class I SAM-dependent methyltransferase [Patescibacteria group bacterium]